MSLKPRGRLVAQMKCALLIIGSYHRTTIREELRIRSHFATWHSGFQPSSGFLVVEDLISQNLFLRFYELGGIARRAAMFHIWTQLRHFLLPARRGLKFSSRRKGLQVADIGTRTSTHSLGP